MGSMRNIVAYALILGLVAFFGSLTWRLTYHSSKRRHRRRFKEKAKGTTRLVIPDGAADSDGDRPNNG
jgi:hypothetical protein